MSKLRKSVEKAEKKLNELRCAVQEIEKHLCFCGFRGEKPSVELASCGEIIVYYNGQEMSIDTAIDYMESPGYISFDDFC